MNYDKAQKFILAELIKYPLISRKSDVGFSDVLVTCDGEVGFVFPKSSLMIDLSVVQKSDDLGRNMEELIDPSNLLQRTKAIIDTDGSSSGYLSVLRDGSREVYVKTKHIKLFGSCAEFYQGKSGGAIAVVEADRLCGVIAPALYNPDDDI
jgi:hypothetical protein